MNRSNFIKGILALGGIALLPANVVKNYRKFYLLQFFVAGFRFYKGMELLDQMNEGDQLELVREPDNEYDDCAIALHWNNEKIGFIPRDENALLSRLIDAQALEFVAEITHLNKKVQPWENVNVAVSFLKESNDEIPEKQKYLTVLATPYYYSYKRSEDYISRVDVDDSVNENDELENNTNWYEFLEENYPDDGIYDIIHSSNIKQNYSYGADGGEYILVNKNRLPANEAIKTLIQKAEDACGELNKLFGEDGYIVLSTHEAEKLVAKTEAVVDIADKLGRRYIELVLKT
jgi:hypothetical protein